jgi:hypothetical protein
MNEPKQHEKNSDDTRRAAPGSTEDRAGDMPAAGVAASTDYEGSRMHASDAMSQSTPASAGTSGTGGMGSMQRAEQFGTETARAGRNVLRGAVSATEDVGTGIVGGAAHLATGLVHGVTDVGYEVRNGATGLIGAVGDIGSAAVNTVAGLLVDVVGGVRQVVNAAVHGHPDGAPRAGWSMPSRQYPEQERPMAEGRTSEEPRI